MLKNQEKVKTNITFMKQILIRFDDICPTMNWEQWDRAESLLNKFNVKPLIGVIPDCKDPDLMIDDARPDFWEWVRNKQEEGYAIAMHGVNHVFCSPHHGILNYRMNSEFAGLSYEEQLHKIKQGREILESHGVKTDIFFAPGHSYDNNTLKALYACGFKYISDGKSAKPYTSYGVTCIPCRSGGVPGMRFGTYHTAVLHAHEWAMVSGKKCYTQFMNLLTNHHSEIVTWDEYVSRPCGNAIVQRLNEWSYVQYQRHLYPMLGKLIRFVRRR